MFRGEEGLGAPLNAIVIFSNRGRDNEGESIGNNMENNSTEDPGIQHSSSGSTENRTGALGVKSPTTHGYGFRQERLRRTCERWIE